MAAKFEVRASGSGFQWVLSSQGRTLATSPTYSRRALAEKAIVSFRMAAIAAPVNDTTPTRGTAPSAPIAKAARTTGRVVGKAADATTKAARTAVKVAKQAATGQL